MAGQQAIWPNVREKLFEDLDELHGRTGPWMVVLFTGDLTQRGSKAEFERLEDTLGALWQHFAGLGSKPVLLAVPGNHDLVRPERPSPTHRLLSKWSDNGDVHHELWSPQSEYRAAIDELFAPYQSWWAGRRDGIPADWTHRAGSLPGDWSVQIPIGERKIGVVGLNSTWVQLTGADYKGKLHLDTQQFHDACGGDGPAWAKANDVSFLLTHHGPDWLSPAGRDHLRSGIDIPPRFVAHMHGHMHGNASYVSAEGGAHPRRLWQASSLFGLEWIGETIERAHGYAAGRIEFAEAEAKVRTWPRNAVKTQAGFWKLGPDRSMDLEHDGGTRLESLVLRRRASESSRPTPPTMDRRSEAFAAAAMRLATIDAYKNLHDEFHKIELLCLRPLLAMPTAQQLRAALRELKGAAAELEDHIATYAGHVDRVLAEMIATDISGAVERVADISATLRTNQDPEFERAQISLAIEELQALLGQYPSKLEVQLSAANKLLREDHRLDGIESLEQLRRDLEQRIDEHSLLQSIDGELRSSKASIRHWRSVKLMLKHVKPVSNSLREAWPDIEADTEQIDALLRMTPPPTGDIAKALENYGQTIASIFRNVDSELKRLLGQLVKSGAQK